MLIDPNQSRDCGIDSTTAQEYNSNIHLSYGTGLDESGGGSGEGSGGSGGDESSSNSFKGTLIDLHILSITDDGSTSIGILGILLSSICITVIIGVFFSFLILCLYLLLSKQIIYYDYLSFCTLFFILGLSDDLKLSVPPKFRLILMIIFLITLIITNKFYIESTGIEFLNRFLEIDIFALFFVCLCFLFIINGANLIDGFNGLLGFHSLIILIVLFIINLVSNNQNIAYILFYSILLNLIFLKFNFPNGKIFLGDSGAYLLGAIIAVSTIIPSKSNPIISPFFFCTILAYLFFEVFFSFFRKLLVVKKSPLLPDSSHLHMFLY